MTRTLALVLLTACGPQHAFSKSDYVLETTFAAETAVDWRESGRFVDDCHESNPAIGACGDRVPLDVYIPVSVILHAVITYAIPRGSWRTAWLGFSAGAELDTIYSNTLVTYGH